MARAVELIIAEAMRDVVAVDRKLAGQGHNIPDERRVDAGARHLLIQIARHGDLQRVLDALAIVGAPCKPEQLLQRMRAAADRQREEAAQR